MPEKTSRNLQSMSFQAKNCRIRKYSHRTFILTPMIYGQSGVQKGAHVYFVEALFS